MASNDPTDTGGLFIGRRPGTAPLRYRGKPVEAGPGRRGLDRLLSALLLLLEGLLCLSLWGPQPIGWMWVGSQVDYATGSVFLGIITAFAGMVATLFITVAFARRVDHAWQLVRRAAGYEQKRGVLERIFIITAGPGPQLAPSS
jgi:hypothetical protein